MSARTQQRVLSASHRSLPCRARPISPVMGLSRLGSFRRRMPTLPLFSRATRSLLLRTPKPRSRMGTHPRALVTHGVTIIQAAKFNSMRALGTAGTCTLLPLFLHNPSMCCELYLTGLTHQVFNSGGAAKVFPLNHEVKKTDPRGKTSTQRERERARKRPAIVVSPHGKRADSLAAGRAAMATLAQKTSSAGTWRVFPPAPSPGTPAQKATAKRARGEGRDSLPLPLAYHREMDR